VDLLFQAEGSGGDVYPKMLKGGTVGSAIRGAEQALPQFIEHFR
jgi:hypothetical protein